MGKGANFSGQPVLSRLIKMMDRQKIVFWRQKQAQIAM